MQNAHLSVKNDEALPQLYHLKAVEHIHRNLKCTKNQTQYNMRIIQNNWKIYPGIWVECKYVLMSEVWARQEHCYGEQEPKTIKFIDIWLLNISIWVTTNGKWQQTESTRKIINWFKIVPKIHFSWKRSLDILGRLWIKRWTNRHCVVDNKVSANHMYQPAFMKFQPQIQHWRLIYAVCYMLRKYKMLLIEVTELRYLRILRSIHPS